MNRTAQKLLLLVPVVALTACGQRKSATAELPADPALRLMFGIRSVTGSLTLPPDVAYYEIGVFNYQDGKLIKRHTPMGGGPVKLKRDRLVSPQLLWGSVGGKMMVSVSLGGSGGPYEDPFWSHIDGGSMSFPDSAETTPEGWTVLGFGASQARRGSNSLKGVANGFGVQLEISKYVGALVIRTFRTEDEWKRALKESSPAAEEPAKAGGA